MQEKGIRKNIGKAIILILTVIQRSFINKIKVPAVKNGLQLLFDPFKQAVKVLTDKDPNNAEQLKQVWRDFISSTKVFEYSNIEISRLAIKIQNEHFRNAILAVSVPVTAMYQMLGDDNPDDAAQLEAHWKAFIESRDADPIALNVIAPFLERNLDEDLADLILTLIQDALDARHDGVAKKTNANDPIEAITEMVLYRTAQA